MIDPSLTLESGLESIGQVFPLVDRPYRDRLNLVSQDIELPEVDLAIRSRFSYEPRLFDLEWVIGSDSEYVRCVQMFCTGEGHEPKRDVLDDVLWEYCRTGIPEYAIGHLNLLLPGEDLKTVDSAGTAHTGTSFATAHEMLINAIEHGSEYGLIGPVRLRFIGGNKGALFIIQDPGKGYDIQPVMNPKKILAEHRMSPRRGIGLTLSTISQEAIVSGRRTAEGYQTLVLYQYETPE